MSSAVHPAAGALLARLSSEADEDQEHGSSFLLEHVSSLWVVLSGQVELYSVELSAELPVGRQFLCAVEAGGLLCGLPVGRAGVALLAVPAVGSVIRALTVPRLRELAAELGEEPAAAQLLAAWGRLLHQSLWPKDRDAAAASSIGTGLPILDGSEAWTTLPAHQTALLAALLRRRESAHRKDQAELRARIEADRLKMAATVGQLAGVLLESRPPAAADPGLPLYGCCKLVLGALGIDPAVLPPPRPETKRPRELAELRRQLVVLARGARLRVRKVALYGPYWKRDNGPLIAYRAEGNHPVALLPTGPGSYMLHDAESGRSERLTAQVAAKLAPLADVLYRPLPARRLTLNDLLSFGLHGVRRDVLSVLVFAALVGLLALVPPVLTSALFDVVIPNAQRGALVQVVFSLLVSGISMSLFNIARGIAVLRAEGRINAELQAAVWDRLLNLPARFFREYSAGDLTVRASGIDQICRSLSGNAASALLSGLFGLFSIALMFVYDARLALLGIGMLLVMLVVQYVSGRQQLTLQTPLAAMHGRMATLVLELINGVAKLRMAGSEGRAFARWAQEFAALRRLTLRSRAPLQVFESVYPLLATLVLYSMVPLTGASRLSAGTFLAFAATLQNLLTSTLQAGQAALSLVNILPTYDRLSPILDHALEVEPSRADPGALTGELELSHVSFRYRPDGPLILDDLSIHVEPGEFVAITGPSGSGKSTVLRLLLGFEKPQSGAVYYNGQDLGGLDVRAVRRQLGVVLQDGKLMTGDIFTNIVGSMNLSREDALEAARMAGFDRDLEQLPMGLHTLIVEGGTTLSGGQRQRLLIARALVHKPPLLLFDEATSALDNQTQALISERIARLAATRVVIAHRLSTIRHADRILVLVDGKLVQSGTYEELCGIPGPFAELARRQTAEDS